MKLFNISIKKNTFKLNQYYLLLNNYLFIKQTYKIFLQ